MADVIVEAVSARPDGPLRSVVAAHHAYRQRGVPPARHLGLPSPYLTVIFTVDEPLTIARHPDPTQPPGAYRALVGGLHTTPAVIEHGGAQSGIQLQVSPLGARALFGVPAGELAGVDLAATDLLGPLARDLQERVQLTSTWAERFRALDRELGRRLDATNAPPPEVCHAWRLLRASHGTLSISAVAAEVGWSERHLAQRFRTEIGLTPKAAARVIRFDRARRALAAGRAGAVVAAACGYTDQSHLIRDFTAFTGGPPGAWISGEVTNLQVRNGAQARGSAP